MQPLPRTIAHELAEERARLFVGREAELARLDALLVVGSPCRIVAISGPGGTGKTELLAAFSRRATSRGVRVAWVDGADVPASEAAFASAITAALANPSESTPELALESSLLTAVVLVIDRFELLASLEAWFRERLLPSLESSLRIVVAGRTPLGPAWSASAAWTSLIDPIALGGLAPPVASAYLARRGVPEARRAEIVGLTGGHPLALALFADVVQRDPARELRLDDQPEVVQALLDNLLRGVPDDLHRQALWSSALARNTTEELLATMVGSDRAPQLFDWLWRLSFIRIGPAGLAPHDLVRDLLCADLAWRYPDLRRQLLARAAGHYRALTRRNPRLRLASVMDAAFLWRAEVPLAGFDAGGLHISDPRPADLPALEAMVLRLHGPEGWALVSHWVERKGELVVVRSADQRPQAMALYLQLDRLEAADVARDPGVARLHRSSALGASSPARSAGVSFSTGTRWRRQRHRRPS